MYVFLKIVYHSIYNILQTIRSPFFWVVVGIIFFQYRKIGELEKAILGKHKKPPLYNVLVSTMFGLIGGLLGSIIFIYFGITINPVDFYFIFPLAILLSIFHPKFMCFSYAGGIVSLSKLIFGWPNIDITGVMIVIAVLHLIESFLVLVDGVSGKIPIFMEREGDIIGGFSMNRIWPVPFTIFVNNGGIYPAAIIAILGYGDYAIANQPEKKSRQTAGLLWAFSITLLCLAWLSMKYYIFEYIAAIFAPLVHEVIIMIGRKKEEKGSFIFGPSHRGLKVLDTLPDSIGKKIGLKSGDTILSINGNKIRDKRDIEDILYFQPKYIWIDIFDREKGLITKEYKNYQEGINSLGIIVVSTLPEYAIVVEEQKNSILKLLDNFKKKKARFRN